jgi:hypothetical protein
MGSLPIQRVLPVYLEGDGEAQAALRRLYTWAKAMGADLPELFVSGCAAEREAIIINSFQVAAQAFRRQVRSIPCASCVPFLVYDNKQQHE